MPNFGSPSGTRTIPVLGLALLLFIFAGSLLFGQSLSSTASLSGIVADPAGARIVGARVTFTSPERGISRTLVTDASGAFSFSLLPPTTYSLKVEAPGFKAYEQPQIVLEVGQAAELNVALSVGSQAEQVVATTELPLLTTDSANLGSEITGKQIVELPLNYRNVIGLAFLDSSLNTLNSGGGGGGQDTADQDISFLNFGGQFMGSSSFLLDGAWNTAMGWGGVIYVPSVDNVQEFKVQTNSFSAQYGWSTGNVINVITKSGSNAFHGDVYEFFRNDALDANFYFNNLNGIPKTPFHRNQFGTAVGGPLYIPKIYKQKDRTFFFAQYEGLQLNNPSTLTTRVPTKTFRDGDLSALLGPQIGTDALGRPILAGQIYSPQSRQIGTDSSGNPVYIRDPIPGNNLAGRIDSVANKILAFYPTATNGSLANNYFSSVGAPTTSNEFSARIDHSLSDSARLYGRFSKKWETKQVQAPLYGADNPAGPGQSNPNNRYSAALGYSQVLSPTLTGSVNLGFERWIEGNVRQGYPFKPSSLGLPGAIDANSPFFPDIQVSGFAELGNGQQRSFSNNVGTLSVDIVKMFSSHTLSFGYMGIVTQLNGGGLAPTVFGFNQAFTSGPDPSNPTDGTGNAFASFLLGTAENGSTGIETLPANSKKYYGFYLQDDWKTTKKLTLNLGLRYDIQLAPTERHNRQVYFDPTVSNPISSHVGKTYRGSLVYNSSGNRGLYRSDYTNIAPRFGLSYLVSKNLVAHGGFGIFFPTTYLGTPSSLGYSQTTTFISSLNGGINPASTLSNPFPQGILPITGNSQGGLTSLGQPVGTVVYQRPSPYVEQWMFGLQYLPSAKDVIEASYVGNHGLRMVTGNGVNLNQLDPQYLSRGTALVNPVANPFYGQTAVAGSGCGLDQPTVPAFQLLLPMPQYCANVNSSMAPVGASSYNALQAKYTHRVDNGLTIMASYTYAKFLSNVSGPEEWALLKPSSIRNYYNLDAERSVDANDIPHSLVLSYIYPLPIGRGKKIGANFNRFVDTVLGGWQVSGINSFHKGVPLSIDGNLNPGSTYGGNQNVDVIADPSRIAHKDINHWFNTDALKQADAGSFGNAPRFFSNLRAPGYNDTDLALAKWVDITEKLRAQFRAEMFNAFNQTNFAPPDTTFGSSSFGTITDANGARNVQLALKIYW
ncbi:MAG: carboxypeptidase regulatory-like domain-containing protein [Candidatus Sulfotelmatobacter sp.]